jgi:hypothetical protein
LYTKIKNFILATLMILAASLGAAKAYIDYQLHLELDTAINSATDFVTIKYSDINTSLLGSIYIDNLHLTATDYAPVQIDTVTLYKAYQFYNPNVLPPHISIAIQGVQIPISDTAEPAPIIISALGYAPYYLSSKELRGLGGSLINADVYLEAKSSPKKISILGMVDAHAWGKFRLSVDLINVPPPTSLSTAASQIKLAKLTFNYTDKGIINRLFTRLAQRNKMTLADFKQTLITKLKNDISQTGMALDTSIYRALPKFTVRLQPAPPITINTLQNASPKRLGLKMEGGK